MMDSKEIFAKLLALAGSVNSDIVFMPMRSKCSGIMTTEKVKYSEKEIESLMHIAEKQGIRVRFVPFHASSGIGKIANEVRIGIRMDMSFDEYVYNIAHELAHFFLHYDKGDTITCEKHAEYEEQADRAAKMLLAALSI